jgi:sigma-B regulation protein RsbU (phosphoserine phosphatase)
MVRAFMAFSLLGIITFILLSLYRAASTQARQRARMILFGFTIAFAPPMIIMGLSFLIKFDFPWNFFPFFIIFFPAAIAYSIVKHNLFDADTIIRRTVGYAVVTALVVGAYALVSISFNVLLGQYQLAQSRAFPILFTLGVILVFNPLRDQIQALVDRVFFRKEYDYGAIIDKIGGAITSLMDLEQILKSLTQTFIKDMFIDTTSVMLLSADGSAYQVYLADGENNQELEKISIKRDEPIIGIIEKEKKELTKNDILEDPKYKSFSETCAKKFEALNASLMVPMIFQDKVIGFLTLGEKKSGKFYNREDIDLLHTVSNQGAVAIENARLFQENLEKQRMEEELNIARDLQTSMLPASCPQIDGFEIAAFSVSAREVGGDFYDFIEMGAEKAGMVIGDVTGKSVSGALVMSASRSVFRMLSEDELSVGESMTRANRRLKKDIKSGMFVALLYVVLNGQDKSMSLCSAGQTQPILLSAQTGEASLVETEGDTFPLGILDEANYQETKLQLERGDKVVLYTDGIVEAMNEKEEMFGFERLMELTQKARSMSAGALLKEIIKRVNEFAGGAAQHDDITVIVVNVEK